MKRLSPLSPLSPLLLLVAVTGCFDAGGDPMDAAASTDGADDDADDAAGETQAPSDEGGEGGDAGTPDPQCASLSGSLDATCPTDAPFCVEGECVTCSAFDNGDQRCASNFDDAPYCHFGECVGCIQGDDCGDAAPICDADLQTCRGCSTHAECPGTACHLAGDLAGTCFLAEEVKWVDVTAPCSSGATGAQDDPYCQLRDVKFLAPGSTVIKVEGTAPNLGTFKVPAGHEVALFGGVLSNQSWNTNVVEVDADARLYLSGASLVGQAANAGLLVQGEAWIHQATVRGETAVAVDAAALSKVRLDGVYVTGYQGYGVVGTQADVALVNTTVSSNNATHDALFFDGGRVDVAYATVRSDSTQGGRSLACQGTTVGQVKNSILLGSGPVSIDDACGLEYVGNVLDTPALADGNWVEPAIDPAWFTSATTHDLHLSGDAPESWSQLATPDMTHPLHDIDGDARPSPGYPGVDQPTP